MDSLRPGTLSYAEFAAAADHFSSWWKMYAAPQQAWEWTTKRQPVTGEEVGFLVLECVRQPAATPPRPLRSQLGPEDAGGHAAAAAAAAAATATATAASAAAGSLPAEGAGGDLPELGSDGADEACVALEAAHAAGMLLWQYHIVYHTSYQVPALCFKATTADGAVLSEAEMLAQLPSMQRYKGSGTPDWAFVTQMEHPVLHVPWLVLHPCQTAQLMSLMLSEHNAACGSNASTPSQHRTVHCTCSGNQAPTDACSSGSCEQHLCASWLGQYLPAWISLVAPVVGLPAHHHHHDSVSA